MQSSEIIVAPAAAATVAPVEESQLLVSALKQLETLGFVKVKQNLRLLKKTNGDLEVVKEFLIAKKKLHDAKLSHKKSQKEGKECRRKEKFERKRETKLFWKGGKKCKEEKTAQKEWKRSVCGKHAGHQKSGVKEERDAHDPNVEAKTLPVLNVWPSQVTRLYLDGNNMLYVAAPLRARAIRHREMSSAEIALSSFACAFGKLLPASVKTTMVFDAARPAVLQSYSSDTFEILSAKPTFGSSDDALVQWAKENAEAHVLSMVVTSDRGLQKRLAEVSGVVLAKPKVWMEYAASMLENKGTVGDGRKINLDDFMSNWMQKTEEESLADQMQVSLNLQSNNNN
jgi:hypothetical protein